MLVIIEDDKWFIEENLFTFAVADIMTRQVFVPVPLIPVKTDSLRKVVNHKLNVYYDYVQVKVLVH